MPKATETENFIKTLSELRNEDCKQKQAELRLRIRASAKQFVEEFRAEIRDVHPRTRRPNQPPPLEMKQFRGG